MNRSLKPVLYAALGLLSFKATKAQNIQLSHDKNFVLTIAPRVAGFDTAALGYTAGDVSHSVSYVDGLGRPMQNIQIKGSPTGNDIVQPIVYDLYGREEKKYLPYAATGDGSFKTSAVTAATAFYNPTGAGTSGAQQGNGIVTIPDPYAQTVFEASPLSRPLIQGAPGADWLVGAHPVKMGYGVNIANDIRLWKVASNGNGASAGSNYYGAGTLTADTLWDENSHATISFKDKQGQVVAKKVQSGGSMWLLTTYIYDDYGQLAYVIPPIPPAPTGTTYPTSFTETDAVFLDFIFGYHYDGRNRLFKKKVPGKGWEYVVFNKLDQVVATQDSIQQGKKQWSYTKYDAQGRTTESGIWNNNNVAITPTALQSAMNGETVYWENATGTGSGYSNASWPIGYTTPLSVTFYDRYGNAPSLPGTYSAPSGASAKTRGLPVATRTAVLNDPSVMLWSVMYYDDEGRAIQTYKQHYLAGANSTKNYDVVSTEYNFAGQPLTITRKHYKDVSGTATLQLTLNDEQVYDHTGRPIQSKNKVNTEAEVVLSQNDYNEIGQLSTKHLHSEDGGGNWLQSVSYAYNERGWMRTSTSSSNLFNMELKYNNPSTGTANYNGNISQMGYSYATSSSVNRTFTYTYDELNRLTNAELASGTTLNEALSYDDLGNIKTLERGGSGHGTLDYGYTNGRLTGVTGYAARSYGYDRNGNATSDGGTKMIGYNMLNLPDTVKVSNTVILKYYYDAAGQKLRSLSTADGTREYIGGIVYEGSNLRNISTAEGRITHNSGVFKYKYDLKDHLGNVRVTFDKNTSTGNAEMVQADEYYAFGLRSGLYDNSNGNRYLYNGKERQVDLENQYDYGARFYDPVIGRFTGVDPIAEKFPHVTTYNYAENEPVSSIDLWGLQRWVVHGRERNTMPAGASDAMAVQFATVHPIAAIQIGSIERGSTNISSVAGRFARHFAEATKTSKDIGSPSNALRHTLWSAMIRTKFDKDISVQATNAHEGVGVGESQYVDMSKPFEGKGQGGRDMADHIVDVLNNGIGMSIAESNPNASANDLVKLALGEFKNNGLWTFSTDKNGNVNISRSKLSKSQYDKAIKNANTLNKNGLTQNEQKEIDQEK